MAPQHNVKAEVAAGIGDSKFSQRLRRLMDQFRAVGLDQELELPTIAIVGSQSAGKSSVMEAISGVSMASKSYLCNLSRWLPHNRSPFLVSLRNVHALPY